MSIAQDKKVIITHQARITYFYACLLLECPFTDCC